ncbi:DUF362 domain-containing protein [candidate division KSB1 bacterium]|nr:DUF362 domain-containing protein [candidate division KSB1 bacterium]
MKLFKKKHLFLLLTCMLIFDFGMAWIDFSPPDMEPWSADLDGQFVTPVSTVALYRSDKSRAEDIEYDEIKTLVNQAIQAAGGLESIVSDGDSVILKPNLVGAGGKRPEVNGVTTDNRVVRAVSEIVRELNPSGWIGVLEGSAPGNNQHTSDMYKLYAYTKSNLPLVDDIICLEDVCGETKDYDSDQLVATKLPAGKALYPNSKKPNNSDEIYFAKLFYNADVIISIPVLKNHESAALTCAIKNTSIGMTPISIYSKSQYNIPNLRYEIEHAYPYMHFWLHDFFMARPTDFVLVDGLQGLQNGPGSSNSNDRMNMRLIMAGKDLVSVDALAAYIIGMDAEIIDYLVYLHNDKVGCADQRLVRLLGNASISDVKKKFKHNDQRTIDRMVSDIKPPMVSINSAFVNGNTLNLSLDVSDDTRLVEIIANGKKLDQNVISNFESIQITGENIAGAGQDIEVIAYDQYRNSASALSTVTGVPESMLQAAKNYELLPNFPNPFNPETDISYRLPETAQVAVTVYSLRGERVKVLESATKNAGQHHVRWDGTDLQGQPAASGIYLYHMVAVSGTERFVASEKMTLVR